MFAGFININGSQAIAEKLQQLAKSPDGLASIPYDDTDYWQHKDENKQIFLIQQRRWNTFESKQARGIVNHQDSDCKILAWARIDNRKELLDQLPKSLHSISQSDDGLILAAYLHWGENLCEYLIGDFVFAIYDFKKNSLLCARDHTGVKPFYYYQDDNIFAFATSMGVLNQLPTLDISLSDKWLVHYLSDINSDWQSTPYRYIKKIPPANQLRYCQGKVGLTSYFNFSPENELILAKDEDYVQAYHEILNKAVSCRVRSDYPIASELSGGLDSSSVTALAAKHMDNPIHNLHAFGFDDSRSAPKYILDAARSTALNMLHLITYSQPLKPTVLSRFLSLNGAPVEHSNGVSHNMFYEIAEKIGARSLLSGFGGDEFVTSEAPVAMVEFYRNRQWQLFISRQRGGWLSKPFHCMRWLYQYYRYQNHSTTSRRLYEVCLQNWNNRIINDNIANEFNVKQLLVRKDIYDGQKLTQNAFALEDRWSPNITARYENCTLMAASYGIEYRWPLLDVRLLKLFLAIPSSQKCGPNLMGRYLHRRAMVGVLPDSIVWNTKDLEPFDFWQRLGLWMKHTPLGRAYKHSIESSVVKNATKNKIDKTEIVLSTHPKLEPFVDPIKLKKSLMILNKKGLSKHHRRVLQKPIQQLTQLNNWIFLLESSLSDKDK